MRTSTSAKGGDCHDRLGMRIAEHDATGSAVASIRGAAEAESKGEALAELRAQLEHASAEQSRLTSRVAEHSANANG